MKIVACFLAVLGLSALAGCVVYDHPYGYTYQAPASFERSWNAAMGAMNDNGVQINRQDRATGVIEGQRGPLTVKARVLSQADGKVRVEFNTSGSGAESQDLAERISRRYDDYMGR
jgi:hypothetical protein